MATCKLEQPLELHPPHALNFMSLIDEEEEQHHEFWSTLDGATDTAPSSGVGALTLVY